jgi:hypothetical protein
MRRRDGSACRARAGTGAPGRGREGAPPAGTPDVLSVLKLFFSGFLVVILRSAPGGKKGDHGVTAWEATYDEDEGKG